MDLEIEPIPELSMEEVQKLGDRDRNEYLAFKRMLTQPGWQQFLGVIRQQHNAQMNSQLTAKNWDSVLLARGAAAAFQTILAFEANTELVYRQLAEKDSETSDSVEADSV